MINFVNKIREEFKIKRYCNDCGYFDFGYEFKGEYCQHNMNKKDTPVEKVVVNKDFHLEMNSNNDCMYFKRKFYGDSMD